jgi:hypothetical protein
MSVMNHTLIFLYTGLRFVHLGGPPQQVCWEMVNYCKMGSKNSIQDALASVVDLLNKKEQESVQLENKLDYLCSELFICRKKHIVYDISHVKGLYEEECQYRKYAKLF